MNAITLIQTERERQIAKGFSLQHDDQHTDGSIAIAAGFILYDASGSTHSTDPELEDDPDALWYEQLSAHVNRKYAGEPLRKLVISAALLVAEIDRQLRAATRNG